MTKMYYDQLEAGEFSKENILTEVKQYLNLERTNKEIIGGVVKSFELLKKVPLYLLML